MSSEKYDISERLFVETRIAWRKSKDLYELTRAKRRQIIKAEVTAEGGKPTLDDLDDLLLIEQNNVEAELGLKYLMLINATSEKEIKHQEMESEKRAYWDNKGINT